MAHCSKCGVEYSEGTAACAKCGAPLLPGQLPAMAATEKPRSGQTQCVRVFRGPTAQMEADLAKNVLIEEGIPCVLPGEEMASVLPGVDLVQLWVRQEDADEAMEILKDFFDSPQPFASDEPSA
jgi:putative signal transducing protein/zinc ribbon protein